MKKLILSLLLVGSTVCAKPNTTKVENPHLVTIGVGLEYGKLNPHRTEGEGRSIDMHYMYLSNKDGIGFSVNNKGHFSIDLGFRF